MDKFSKILVSAAAASVLASGAMASGLTFGKLKQDGKYVSDSGQGLDVTDGVTYKSIKDAPTEAFGPIKVDDLLTDYTDLEINSADTTNPKWPGTGTKYNRMLSYWAGVDLMKNSTLKFEISCGQLKKESDGIFLFAYDCNATGQCRSLKVGSLIDKHEVANGSNTGYDMVRFKLDSTLEVAGDHNFTKYDGTQEDVNDSTGLIPAGTLLVFGTNRSNGLNTVPNYNDGNITRLNLLPKKGKTCGCTCDMTIKLIDARDDNAQPLSDPMSGTTEAKLVTYVPGLKAKVQHLENGKAVDGYATSYISTATGVDRKKFIDENITINDTGLLTSRFFLNISNDAEYGIDLTNADRFTLNVNRAIYCAVKNVTIYDDAGNSKALTKNADGAYVLTGKFGTGTTADEYHLDMDNNISINVNGTDVICPGMWRVSLEVDFDENGVPNKKLLDVANAADWRINAMQFIIPYLNTDPNYGTYIVITNMGDKAASVFFDAYGDSGKNEGQASYAYYTNIQLGDIPRRSTRIYFPKDMNNALKAKFPAWHANRYLAKFYVVADQNNIEAAAFQKDGNNGKRSIPVLTQSLQIDVNSSGAITRYTNGHYFKE